METNLKAGFTVATYNIGQVFDFQDVLLRHGAQAVDPTIHAIYEAVKVEYDTAAAAFHEMSEEEQRKKFWDHPRFKPTAETLKLISPIRKDKLQNVYDFMHKNCDLILLQEVVDGVDMAEEVLGQEKFAFAYNMTQEWNKLWVADSVVAWNKEKFVKVETPNDALPMSQSDERTKTKSAIVRLQEIASGRFIDIASIHAPGYPIKNPTVQNVANGEKSIQLILDVFNTRLTPADISLIAGDFNSLSARIDSDEVKHDLSQRRFQLLKDSGFQAVEHHQMTAYNADIATLKEGNGNCDLDHIYVKNGLASARVDLLLQENFNIPLNDPSLNPSDHRPLFFNVTIS